MSRTLPKAAEDNLRFLAVEVDAQLSALQSFFSTPTLALAGKINDRSGYTYNLKSRIHSSCANVMATGSSDAQKLVLRALELIATDLERLGALARDCVRELMQVEAMSSLNMALYDTMLSQVRSGVAMIVPAWRSNDTQLALSLGEQKQSVDALYGQLFEGYLADMRSADCAQDLVQGLFVSHHIQEMGEVILNISEAIVSANIGQPMNLERYHSLQSLMADLNTEPRDIQVETIAETRSGSAISGLSTSDQERDAYFAIFKDGLKRKVKEERDGVRNWHEIYPGLAPKILSYKKRGQSAALLIEHLPGVTFEQLVLNESKELLDQALHDLVKTLRSVWRHTQRDQPVQANYMEQLRKRMPEVYRIHREFANEASRIGDVVLPSFDALIDRVATREKSLVPPFAVYIHGDFNIDNIIYDPLERRINFIDLHRSRYMDYVQDVSVFMVSNYRLQILDAPTRHRILELALRLYKIAKRFAKKMGDDTFEIRLALGLARSFATSTRFILDKSLARQMFLRSRYLLEKVAATGADEITEFKLPCKELFSD